jgi:ribosome biogenesis protein
LSRKVKDSYKYIYVPNKNSKFCSVPVWIQIEGYFSNFRYAVPDIPYSLGANVTTSELNTLINTLLQESSNAVGGVEFDFLIRQEFLRSSLGKHLRVRDISFEDVIEVEYIERFPAPEPQDCLLHDDWVSAIEARGNFILTGCYDNTLNLWTLKGKHLLTIPGHGGPIKGVSWISLDDHNGVFASASQDQTAIIWEWNIKQNSVECVQICKGHERGVDCIDVLGAKMATGSWDNMLKVWSTNLHETDASGESSSKKMKTGEGQTRTPILTLEGHREAISAVQWIDESTLLTASWDHTFKIWDLHVGGIKNETPGNKSFFDISYSSLNGLILTASPDKNIRLYDPRSNRKFSP